MQQKLCGKCQKIKAISEFSKEANTVTGYKWACKPCEIIRRKESYARHRQKRIDASKAWKHKYPDLALQYMRDYRMKLRLKIIEGYGGKCQCCNESHVEFLTLDHINDDGKLHRGRNGSLGAYRDIIKREFPKEYRILCMNCNWAIRFRKVCPHKKEILT